MRLNRHNLRTAHHAPRSGVALVITIVMLSVITFLTVAFLALMGREKGSVKTAVDQSTARFAAEAALERAKAELIAGILASTNLANFDLLVSTNYINVSGFDPGAVDQLTNVNYDYQNNAPTFSSLTPAQALQNLTNLFYNPRVPVFITNRLVVNSNEFRYYLDLNRNRRHDVTGLWPVISDDSAKPYFDTNGLKMALRVDGNTLSNQVVGDPEWIGGLDRADKPHSADNKFLYRYAYIAVPAGKTLDVNYIHNQAATRSFGPFGAWSDDNFFRNQGVGTWELNLAGLLADLNTNIWNPNPTLPTYSYSQADVTTGIPTGFGNTGVAFDDARNILAYRYANDYNTLALGYPSFNTGLVDEYSDGGLLISPTSLVRENDSLKPWAGSDNTNHYFTAQELFTKPVGGFAARMQDVSTNLSTYDQYTYYRLLSQLGTDSAPEDPDKLNLNYVNVGGLSVTNFVSWTNNAAIQSYFGPTMRGSELFFTNAVDRLLKAYTAEWLAADYMVYTNIFKTDQIFGVTNIPVFVSNQFIYPPAVHRILQVAANIWETKNGTNAFPTVFQPHFTTSGSNIYISSFVQVERATDLPDSFLARPILDITATNNPAAAIPADGNVLIYGVPLVVGAKKYLPNFNEFSMESTFVLTRKLQLRKDTSGRIIQTNQFFTMALTMPSAAEFWNSYATNYNRPVSIFVTNRTTMTLTNDLGVVFTNTFVTGQRIDTNNWLRYQPNINNKSFIVAMRTNVPFLPLVGYLPDRVGNAGFVSATNAALFDTSQALLAAKWGMTITNRVHAMILEQGTDRIIDYVLLGNMTAYRNLTEEFSNPATGSGDPFEQLWATNALSSGRLSGRLGVVQQINISRGAAGGVNNLSSGKWKSFGNFKPDNVDSAVAGFNKFVSVYNTTNLTAAVPFSPSIVFSVPMLWQANDPLVHYLSGELFDLEESGQIKKIDPPTLLINTNALVNIGKKNTRYKPWNTDPGAIATDPDAFNAAIKDPLVTRSDDWQFPTNMLPTVGWLGRVHRGTPWQTIYLKSSNVGLTNIVNSPTEWANSAAYKPTAEKWANWIGNKTLEEGFYTRPVADRVLFDVFTTALNDNSTRGRLSVNVGAMPNYNPTLPNLDGLAAWSALFSGVVALTNVSTEEALKAELPPVFSPMIIEPAGTYDPLNATTWPPLVRMVDGINRIRANTNFFPNGTFAHLGDILAVPELTDASPFLNLTAPFAPIRGMTDAAYEWLPQQTMSLLQLGEPRFVIYAYGQSLQPAPDSIITAGGSYFGLCTNYAITAEVATRTVVRIEGSPNPAATNTFLPPKKRYPPHVVVESFNFLPPE